MPNTSWVIDLNQRIKLKMLDEIRVEGRVAVIAPFHSIGKPRNESGEAQAKLIADEIEEAIHDVLARHHAQEEEGRP